jgi:hypothetical protein
LEQPASASDVVLQHQSDRAGGGAGVRVRRSELEESWDSLEHFKHHHSGRLPPADGSTAAPLPSAVSSAAAGLNLNLPSAAVPVEDLLASDRKRPSRSNSMADDSLLLPQQQQQQAMPLQDVSAIVPSAASYATATQEDSATSSNAALIPSYPFTSSSFFSMPTLPRGRRLTLHLHSTYGDSYYIGLAGLDLFDGSGKRMSFGSTPEARKSRITASPADLNVLPGYHNDPRVVSNLLDGVNASTDDMIGCLSCLY